MDALLEPLSPELVLVCPELREAALARSVSPVGLAMPVRPPLRSSTHDVPARLPMLVVAVIYLLLSVVRTVVPAVGIAAAIALGVGLLS